jgi:hypothetical protein
MGTIGRDYRLTFHIERCNPTGRPMAAHPKRAAAVG